MAEPVQELSENPTKPAKAAEDQKNQFKHRMVGSALFEFPTEAAKIAALLESDFLMDEFPTKAAKIAALLESDFPVDDFPQEVLAGCDLPSAAAEMPGPPSTIAVACNPVLAKCHEVSRPLLHEASVDFHEMWVWSQLCLPPVHRKGKLTRTILNDMGDKMLAFYEATSDYQQSIIAYYTTRAMLASGLSEEPLLGDGAEAIRQHDQEEWRCSRLRLKQTADYYLLAHHTISAILTTSPPNDMGY